MRITTDVTTYKEVHIKERFGPRTATIYETNNNFVECKFSPKESPYSLEDWVFLKEVFGVIDSRYINKPVEAESNV